MHMHDRSSEEAMAARAGSLNIRAPFTRSGFGRFVRVTSSLLLMLLAGACTVSMIQDLQSPLQSPLRSIVAALSGGIGFAAAFGAYLLARR